MLRLAVTIIAASIGVAAAHAEQVAVEINKITAEGVGARMGAITLEDASGGLQLTYQLDGLTGSHGFHVHEIGDCGPGEKDGKVEAGIAAGDHYDPEQTGKHAGPAGEGHKGDLPLIKGDGKMAQGTVVAPRLKLAEVKGRSLMIHEGSDTYSDQPKLGGGKGRIACGVIPK